MEASGISNLLLQLVDRHKLRDVAEKTSQEISTSLAAQSTNPQDFSRIIQKLDFLAMLIKNGGQEDELISPIVRSFAELLKKVESDSTIHAQFAHLTLQHWGLFWPTIIDRIGNGPDRLSLLKFLQLILQSGSDDVLKVAESVVQYDSIFHLVAKEKGATELSLMTSLLSAEILIHSQKFDYSRFEPFNNRMGEAIFSMLADNHKSLPFKIWARWLSILPVLPKEGQLSEYWHHIRNGLRNPLQQLLDPQKLVLYILRRSLLLANHDIDAANFQFRLDQRAAVIEQFEKYCRLFETIILGRYTNQVVEAIQMIPQGCLHSSTTSEKWVSSSWWVTLFTAALRQLNTDTTSRVVGDWVLRQEPPTVAKDPEFQDFVATTLIPWACSGYLYHRSIERQAEFVICEHGDSLSSYCGSLMAKADSYNIRSDLAIAILRQLSLKPARLTPHAMGYILLGLSSEQKRSHQNDPPSSNTSISAPRQPWFRPEIGELASGLLKSVPMSSIQRKFLSNSVNSILQLCGFEPTASGDTVVAEIPTEPIDWQLLVNASIKTDDPRIFQGHALRWCIKTVFTALEDHKNSGKSIDGTELSSVLAAIWMGAERQQFSRQIVEDFPRLFFDAAVISLSAGSPALQTLLKLRLQSLLQQSRRKIQLWNPIAEALWTAYFQFDSEELWSLGLEEFVLNFVSEMPVPGKDSLLDAAVSQVDSSPTREPILADEGYGHALIFDILNRIKSKDRDRGRSLLKKLLKTWEEILDTGWKSGAREPNIPSLQAIFLLSESCLLDVKFAQDFRKTLFRLLAVVHPPIFRFLLEWIVTSTCWRFPNDYPSAMNELFVQLNSSIQDEKPLRLIEKPPRLVVSLLRIAVNLVRNKASTQEFAVQLMTLLIPFCVMEKVSIRWEALWTLPLVMDMAAERQWTEITENFAYSTLYKHVRNHPKQEYIALLRESELFDPSTDHHLGMLFEGPWLRMDQSSQHVGLISTKYFERIEQQHLQLNTSGITTAPAHFPLGKPRFVNPKRSDGNSRTAKQSSDVLSTAFQSKAFVDTGIRSISGPAKNRQIVLVGSLITSPPNLGGLSRVSEIFGCSALHIPDIKLLKDSGFQAVSMTSEMHIPVHETKPEDLVPALRKYKADGFLVVGIEQTDSSGILGDDGVALPEKVVLVLGSEKLGLPVEVLFECDRCVEIRQFGQTRSLNVQTAAAVVLYEWRRQFG